MHHPLPFLGGALCIFLWAAERSSSTGPGLLSQEPDAVGGCCAHVLPAAIWHAQIPGQEENTLHHLPMSFSFLYSKSLDRRGEIFSGLKMDVKNIQPQLYSAVLK